MSLVLPMLTALAACGGPQGSAPPSADGLARGGVFTPAPAPSGVPARSSALGSIGGQNLEVTAFSVDEALAAEGGDAVGAMLDDLGISPGDVELSVAVAPRGDPAISDWSLPGSSAGEILAAWSAAAPGSWTDDNLDGTPALVGNGPDGTRAWAFAFDDRFVYVRTDDRDTAAEVAAALDS